MHNVSVPTKIVLAGTSTMKLNDRFSNLPPPTKQTPARVKAEPKFEPRRGASGNFGRAPRNGRLQQARSQEDFYEEEVYEDDYDDFLDEEMMEPEYIEQYVPVQPRGARGGRGALRARARPFGRQLPRQRMMPLHVPIEDRITIPAPPKVVYVPMQTNGGMNRIGRGMRGARGSRGRGGQQRQHVQKRPNFGVQQQRGFKRGNGGNRGNGSRNIGNLTFTRRGGQKQSGNQKKSISQLDRELEDYMRKKKHTPVTI